MKLSEPQRQLAAALGRIPSGLFILTVRRGEAETGVLVSFVQQCSFEPPQLSFAMKPDRPVVAWLTPGTAFTLNILDDSQTDMVGHFGRGFALDQPAFTELDMERSENGCPVLSEALAYVDGEVVARYPAGDHDLFIARVVGGKLLGEGHPMVHIRKSGLHY
jgi:flavin reductase (DIM6/NTAB) family NADH-FMN oxidoreductase RutF